MNSFDDIIIDKTELNDIDSLRQRMNDMSNWIDHLDEENHSYRRRLYVYYENMIDLAYIMEKIMTEYGEDKIKAIIDQYFDFERHAAMKRERQLAKSAKLSFDFVNLESLFSIKL